MPAQEESDTCSWKCVKLRLSYIHDIATKEATFGLFQATAIIDLVPTELSDLNPKLHVEHATPFI